VERHHNGNVVKQSFYAVQSLGVLFLCVEGMQSQFKSWNKNEIQLLC
jgi:hypothetical protein